MPRIGPAVLILARAWVLYISVRTEEDTSHSNPSDGRYIRACTVCLIHSED